MGVKQIAVLAKWVVFAIIGLVVFFTAKKMIVGKMADKSAEQNEVKVEELETQIPLAKQKLLRGDAETLKVLLMKVNTDEQAVYNSFDNISTDAEMELFYGYFHIVKEKTLLMWIRKRMSKKEIAVLNDLLSNKGLTQQF